MIREPPLYVSSSSSCREKIPLSIPGVERWVKPVALPLREEVAFESLLGLSVVVVFAWLALASWEAIGRYERYTNVKMPYLWILHLYMMSHGYKTPLWW